MPTCWDDLPASPALAGRIVITLQLRCLKHTTLATLIVQMQREDKAVKNIFKIRPKRRFWHVPGVEPAERVKNGRYAVGIVSTRTTPSVRRWMAIH